MKHRSMTFALVAAGLLGTIFSGPAAFAQSAAPASAPPQPGTYRIAPDDVLSITVINSGPASLSVPQVVVVPDGTISAPLIGLVSVTGKTTTEVAQALTRQWSHYVVNPVVTVSLVQKHIDYVYVSGFVARPGEVTLTPSLHTLDAVAEAGDTLPNGDMSQVVLTHADGAKQTLDLTPSAIRAGTAPNPLLLPGDTIAVPEQRAEFTVIGEVVHPGSFNYKPDMTVMDALTASGGVNPDSAGLKDATLTHNGQTTPLDLDALLHDGDTSKNVKLSAGDQINVPRAVRSYVYGAVYKPGFYNYKPGDRLMDALNAVGGPTPDADYKKVNVVHIDKSKNQGVVQKINMEDFFKKADVTANPVLQPGDAVFIDSKGAPKPKWYESLYAVGALGSAARLFGL